MNVKIKCKSCEEIFAADKVSVNQEEVLCLANGRKLLQTFYVCPKCAKKVVVQLDSEETLEMLKNCKKLILRKVKKIRKKKQFSENSQKELKRLQDSLKDERYKLAVMYDGKVVVDKKDIGFVMDASYIKESREAEYELRESKERSATEDNRM